MLGIFLIQPIFQVEGFGIYFILKTHFKTIIKIPGSHRFNNIHRNQVNLLHKQPLLIEKDKKYHWLKCFGFTQEKVTS